ncbi:hypothetical protein FO519_004084 [Halicephalobus sp. NKZ332]|nr:hypothetical protein FO519_004084 [Halicephalobus sp. NKZ332]
MVVGILGIVYISLIGIPQEIFAAGVYLVFAGIMFAMSFRTSTEVYTAMMIFNGILILFEIAITIILFCASKYPNEHYRTVITLKDPDTGNLAFVVFVIGFITACLELSGFILIKKAIDELEEEKRKGISKVISKSIKNH